MNTSAEAVRLLQEALASTQSAKRVIDDLITAHDYQDAATLVTQAAVATLEAAVHLMQSKDEDALNALEQADDLLEAFYDIVDGETDED